MTCQDLRLAYQACFGPEEDIRLFRAPGRVNLIGEHTDYNLGLVLPFALDRSCYVAAGPNRQGYLDVVSSSQTSSRRWPVGGLGLLRRAGHWTDYVAAVAVELEHAGYPVPPRNLYIHSDIPLGAGLSSSAALEVAVALALLPPGDVDKLDLVHLCHRAETRFVGLPCGIMDQFASLFGVPGCALKLDCRRLSWSPVPLPADAVILAVNSRVDHQLAASAYRKRTEECAEAVRALETRFPEVETLRDATLDMLELAGVPPLPARRARHVITENRRVEEFARACRSSALPRLGKLLEKSHLSLRDDYEVSCPELDFLVDAACANGAWGARLIGGGFGGCTIQLLPPDRLEEFINRLGEAYYARFGLLCEFYLAKPVTGASEILYKNFESFAPLPSLHQ